MIHTPVRSQSHTMMFQTLSVLSVLAAAQACCVPKVWEADEGDIMGISRPDLAATGPATVLGSANMAYDANNQRIAYTTNINVNDFSDSIKVILDYRAGIQYTIHGGVNCTKTALGLFREACVPDNAEYYKTYFGANKKLNITTYRIAEGGFTSYVTVTDNCIPVTETLYGQYENQYSIQTIGYSNGRPGVVDPSVFTPPASCAQGPVIKTNLSPMRRSGLFRF